MAASRSVCEVCGAEPSKYCCPKCALRTCSLTCVSSHKTESGCDGIRDKIAYVPLNKFDDLTLLNDYRLLEETARCVNNAQRNLEPTVSFHGKERLPYFQYRLVTECKNRGINLRLMPKTFQRRCTNTTYFKFNEKKIYWHVEWSFPQAEATYTDHRIAEDCTLSVAIEKYLNPEQNDSEVCRRLAYYQSAGYGGVIPLLKAEGLSSNKTHYYELDFSETITSNLNSKTIVEFPTIVIVMREHIHCYSVIGDEDEEEEEDTRSETLKKRKKTERILSDGECSTTASDEERIDSL